MSNHSAFWTLPILSLYRNSFILVATLASIIGCSKNKAPQSHGGIEPSLHSPSSKETKIDPPNELGFAKISIRDGDVYQEGIIDADGNEVVRPRADMLVSDIDGNLALVQLERKFLFVPLDQGSISVDEMESVDGFQYAEPYRCGFALVSHNNVFFYIDSSGNKAFGSVFEFAESFHCDRALVRDDNRYRIIDTGGMTVAELHFEQVNPQSPWCWQVTRVERNTYRSGFVDLIGYPITELIYDEVGKYDPNLKRIPVSTNGRHGFLDDHAKVVIPVIYDYAEVFDRGKAKVVLNGRTFFINPDGIEVSE